MSVPITTFTKNDTSKPPLSILFDTGEALNGVANVMKYGADKYSRKNWQKVDNQERYLSAALRHLSAHSKGETTDEESGLQHIDHAITSLLFISQLQKEQKTYD